RCVRRSGRRKGRSLRQGPHRQGRRRSEVIAQSDQSRTIESNLMTAGRTQRLLLEEMLRMSKRLVSKPFMSKTALLAAMSLGARAAPSLAAAANAHLVARKEISSAMAMTMAETAIATCKANGYDVSAHVVGRNGEVIVAMRGDNTGPHTLENSMKKA